MFSHVLVATDSALGYIRSNVKFLHNEVNKPIPVYVEGGRREIVVAWEPPPERHLEG